MNGSGRDGGERRPGGRRRVLLGCLAALGLAGTGGWPERARGAEPITVFAAASLADAMKALAARWAAAGHPQPRLSFASSAVLARQIGAGAPAGVFISADEKWMDWVANKGLLEPGTRGDLLSNTLVLVEPKAALKPAAIGPGFDFAAVLGAGGRLAVGDPGSVPAGIYAEQALTALGAWDKVKFRLAPAENVRAALLLVQRGEAPAGIVYGSDVRAAPDLGVAGVFPENSHPPIRYPAAVVGGQGGQEDGAGEARALLAFLKGPDAAAVFERAGFGVLPQ